MTTFRAATAATALAITTALALAGCSAGGSSGSPDAHGGGHGGSALPDDVSNADVMFVAMMIPHHEQAIEMSDMLLAKEDVPSDVAALAEDITAAQGPEIDQLEAWLDEWGVGSMGGMGDMEGMGDMGSMDGMMSEDDMAELEAATGAEATPLFLEQMIEHHEGAIDMAEAEIADGSHEGAIALAHDIIDAQTEEIALMREMLADANAS
ncbi:DUF305 domain-containing protein [Microbacterium sp. ZXX196]|uniref:DUF305 domain-containing protein n=1 Tax=Microbacterium sp. ZXX196 TaxID=2609291 RepID=UPI0012B8EA4A|nr:DUF305 domain-containing protein [Microbacterium sp. ZXX196]MTE23289.1 DUF305 domain-containing protein [Microbacterium sp. ZXX196]